MQSSMQREKNYSNLEQIEMEIAFNCILICLLFFCDNELLTAVE